MSSLIFAVYFLIYAVCDLFQLPPFRGKARQVPPEKERGYRIRRGIILLLLVAVFVYVFIVERVLHIDLSYGEAALWFGLPFAIPVCSILVLNKRYNIPLFG